MTKKYSFEDVLKIVSKKPGKVLSSPSDYKSSTSRLKFRCVRGHEWQTRAIQILNGHWCAECIGKKKKAIEDMHKLAKSKRGWCLSTEYFNAYTKLKWKCEKKDHPPWKAAPTDIQQGKWCQKCAIERNTDKKRGNIEDQHTLADGRRGKCLSTEYKTAHDKLLWQCELGHPFWSTPANAKRRWCPKCSTGVSERVCKKIFEMIFEEEFPKRRPTWLKNTDGNQMHLDGYSEKIGVAFEYHGRQHFMKKADDYFHRSSDTLSKRIADDKRKRELCPKNNVVLVEVPHDLNQSKYQGTTYIQDMETYALDMKDCIVQQCKERNFNIKIPENDILLDELSDVYSPKFYKKMKEYAKAQGGKCHSEAYYTAHTKYDFSCKKNHSFKMSYANVRAEHWCPKCVGKAKLTIEDMHELAARREKGGKCLSLKYVDNKTKLRWQCKKGHIWLAIPSSVKRGSWCPECRGRKPLTIEDMQRLAKKKGGFCLSSKYKNFHTKLRWKCKHGHSWKATPAKVKSGTWCPKCGIKSSADKRRGSIQEMKKLADGWGLNVLSEEYFNARTKLKWQCKKGHIFEARPDNLKRRPWCPVCAKKKIQILKK